MRGVKIDRKGDMYLVEFESYTTMIGYLNMKRPSQVTVSFDGDELTAAIPVQAYSVRPQNEAKE